MDINTLFCISPVDGRYRKMTEKVADYFSEYAYIKYRVKVEIEWLKYILKSEICNISKEIVENVDKIYDTFDMISAMRVKEIEKITNHDVKAIEYYIKEEMDKINFSKYKNFVHFGCTSEDINNIAYALMCKEFRDKILAHDMKELISKVKKKAIEYKDVSMLAHTHGQPATPTTVGKELAIFVHRWQYVLEKMLKIEFCGKFSGAVGNYNAHVIAYENIDWIEFNKNFVNSLELKFNPLTTQIESHDVLCEFFSYLKLFNNITLDFNSDMWMYISRKYFKQKVIETEVGSSVMPHKVNPINHENSMANIHMANSIIDNFTNNLQISRMQRDLSDSSTLRNIGVVFSHTLVSIIQSIKGFEKMEVDVKVLENELDDNPEILAEAIQTVLRKNGYNDAYESLKKFTRGKEVTLDMLKDYITSLDIDEEDRKRLLNLRPSTYIGLASKLVDFIE